MHKIYPNPTCHYSHKSFDSQNGFQAFFWRGRRGGGSIQKLIAQKPYRSWVKNLRILQNNKFHFRLATVMIWLTGVDEGTYVYYISILVLYSALLMS